LWYIQTVKVVVAGFIVELENHLYKMRILEAEKLENKVHCDNCVKIKSV